METKEQKIKRLKKEIETVKIRIGMLMQYGTETQLEIQLERLTKLEQELKELEDGNKGKDWKNINRNRKVNGKINLGKNLIKSIREELKELENGDKTAKNWKIKIVDWTL